MRLKWQPLPVCFCESSMGYDAGRRLLIIVGDDPGASASPSSPGGCHSCFSDRYRSSLLRAHCLCQDWAARAKFVSYYSSAALLTHRRSKSSGWTQGSDANLYSGVLDCLNDIMDKAKQSSASCLNYAEHIHGLAAEMPASCLLDVLWVVPTPESARDPGNLLALPLYASLRALQSRAGGGFRFIISVPSAEAQSPAITPQAAASETVSTPDARVGAWYSMRTLSSGMRHVMSRVAGAGESHLAEDSRKDISGPPLEGDAVETDQSSYSWETWALLLSGKVDAVSTWPFEKGLVWRGSLRVGSRQLSGLALCLKCHTEESVSVAYDSPAAVLARHPGNFTALRLAAPVELAQACHLIASGPTLMLSAEAGGVAQSWLQALVRQGQYGAAIVVEGPCGHKMIWHCCASGGGDSQQIWSAQALVSPSDITRTAANLICLNIHQVSSSGTPVRGKGSKRKAPSARKIGEGISKLPILTTRSSRQRTESVIVRPPAVPPLCELEGLQRCIYGTAMTCAGGGQLWPEVACLLNKDSMDELRQGSIDQNTAAPALSSSVAALSKPGAPMKWMLYELNRHSLTIEHSPCSAAIAAH
jgi:hypothetical protein